MTPHPTFGRPAQGLPRIAARAALLGTLIAGVSVAPLAWAEPRPSLNFFGASGLIDMPSGEAQPDGQLSFSSAHFGPNSRNTLSFQITPRLSASFRYVGIRDWNARVPLAARVGVNGFETYYDRSFDIRYKLLNESAYLPSVTIGLQDFAGTGLMAGEYIAATKNFGDTLKVTAGLGWGRLGSHGSIGSPLGARPPVTVGLGGSFNFDQWFRGPAAPFGGVEWKINDAWTLKGEYSSDNYDEEATRRGTFSRKSPLNFGVEYQRGDSFRVGAYYMYGSTFGIAGHLLLNPKKPSNIVEKAPNPVKPRPARSANSEAWSPEWVTQAGVGPILRGNIAKRLADDGIIVESIGYSVDTAQIRIRNTRMISEAQAIGRTARAMSQTLPASVEVFEIVPMVNGVPAAKVRIRRSKLEELEFSPDGVALMRAHTEIGNVSGPLPDTVARADLYPAFKWSVAPFVRLGLFDPDSPLRADLALRFAGSVDIAPGWVVSGSVTQRIAGNLDQVTRPSNSVLPRVRTEGFLYDRNSGPALEKLTLAWYAKPTDTIYTRVTAGYLERMFGGISAEMLWKPVNSPLALGVEVNYARQRDFNQGFGFQNYSVVTGHVSAYYDFGKGFVGQLDVGRYLARDIGATLTLEREFSNGWRVGAFATKTNVSSAEFGEGSFDKGIRVVIPLGALTGRQTKATTGTVLRPITRDGGARLSVDGRLYDGLRNTDTNTLTNQFGRFWK